MIEKIEKEAKHTEGPWKIKADKGIPPVNVCLYGPDNMALLSCLRPKAEREATARLIAAAPEMLAACEAVRQCLEIMDNGQGNITSGCVFVQLADAIALARKGASP